MKGKTLTAAAAAAGMSERSGRNWRDGKLPSQKKRRRWRTRPDPFAGVWEEQIAPLLGVDKDAVLSANTILEWLDRQYPVLPIKLIPQSRSSKFPTYNTVI